MRFRSAVVVVAAASASVLQAQTGSPSALDSHLYARLMAMTDSRTFDRSLVDSGLSSRWAPLRAASALAVGQVGSSHGMPGASLLRSLLTDRHNAVASNAAYALGLLRDSTAIPSLAAALKGNASVAREAAWALGEIGGPARTAITGALASPTSDAARTIQLLFAAAKLRPIPVASARPYLALSNRPSVIYAAVYAIARNRSPAGVRDLITLGTNADFVKAYAADVRRGAGAPRSVSASVNPTAEAYVLDNAGRERARAELARGLSKGAAGDSLGDMAVGVLLALANDAHPHVRINAVRSLATFGAKGKAAVVNATRDTDANVRIASAQSLGTVLDSAVASWEPLWQRDTSGMYRASLLASAVRAGARMPQLTEWMTARDWHARAAVVNAAGGSPDTALASRIARAMVKDADGRVRASAYGLLAGNDTAALPPAIHQALIEGLSDKDFYARATVIGNLASHPRAVDVPAVLASYSRSLADSGNDARIAAIQYLSLAWKKDSVAFPPELRQRLRSLAPSSDPLVRAQAESTSVLSHWPSTSGNPRPLEWYQNIVTGYVIPALRGRTQRATIRTQRGSIVLELFGADAPITVWNFMNLARTGYYKGTGFHRVVPNFVAQDGDPRDDGNGGPGYAIRDEFNPRRYERGALGMALSGPDTGGSQYFITHSPQPHLDGHYTVFGRVLTGYPALDRIVQGDRILSITVR
ncbi:MAG TPA: peptidylprolyl isomerase [Gemmatimonadaceae bacterium]|nr:peptidylprolyl isomerase [Gemmatimonadaceae bacterium]